MSVRRCFRFSKVLAVLFTVYVSKRYFDNRPVFRQTKTARLFLFFACGHFGEPGFTPQAARCTVSCKIPVSEHRETGICSCLLQSNTCEIFLCFAKAFGQPLKTTHRVVFLTLSFKSLLLSVEKQKRTSNHLSVLFGGETGICSCLLQSNTCEIFLCFAKAFGQPLKTTHRVVFLTLSFKSLLLSVEKQKRASNHLSVLFGGETGI